MIGSGPVVLTTVGDQYLDPVRLSGVVWTGASTAGDVVELRDPVSGGLLWEGRASDSHTYLGISWNPYGLHCPHGFRLATLSSGRVLVYLREE